MMGRSKLHEDRPGALHVRRGALLLLSALLFVGSEARAQLGLEISQLTLRYRVLSRTTSPDENTRAELRRLETELLEARQQGQTGPAFRALQKAIALMEGKSWTPAQDFAFSLVMTPGFTVGDPAQPLVVQIGQRYLASADRGAALTARVSLSRAPKSAADGGPKTAKPLGVFSGFASDLVFEPFRFAVDLAGVHDGQYRLQAEVLHGDQVIRSLEAPLHLIRNLDATRRAVEERLEKVAGFERVKASIRYPFDLALSMNLGRLMLNAYDFPAALAKTEELLASIAAGKDPSAGAAGNLERHYFFEEAGEIMPYRVYVPKSYDGARACPLVVALHGLGGTESTLLQQGNGVLGRLAEERGWLVAAPLGYRRHGGYGRIPGVGSDPRTARMTELSEKDVLNVLRLVREEYRVDPRRIYLMGHSMGGNGTWTLGARHAEIWAALAPIAGGSSTPGEVPLERLKEQRIPVMVVHGDQDQIAPVAASRAMVAVLKKLGVDHQYIEVPGAGHGNVVVPNLPRIFAFFDKQARIP